MTERYWEAGDAPEALLDWVNENVIEAIEDCWDDDNTSGWIHTKDDRLVLIVAGPEKPTSKCTTGNGEIYTWKFDILKELTEYSKPYADIGGPRGEAQRDDVRKRVAELRKLADDISKLAEIAEISDLTRCSD